MHQSRDYATKEAKREYQHAWIEVAIKWRIRDGFYGRIFEARRRNNQSKELILRAQSKDYQAMHIPCIHFSVPSCMTCHYLKRIAFSDRESWLSDELVCKNSATHGATAHGCTYFGCRGAHCTESQDRGRSEGTCPKEPPVSFCRHLCLHILVYTRAPQAPLALPLLTKRRPASDRRRGGAHRHKLSI
jgi:hypothetical protein